MTLTEGIHDNIDEAAYHADPCPEPSLSSSIAHRLVSQSPRHAWEDHPRLNSNHKPKDTSTFDLGACAHKLLLGVGAPILAIDPKDYPGKKGGIPDGWTNDAIREARDAAHAAGKIPVLPHQYDACNRMAEVAFEFLRKARKNGDIDFELSQGKAEQTVIWREHDLKARDYVWCRARIDWRRDDGEILLDYKSTAGSAKQEAWIRNQLYPMGYDLQSAHYQRGTTCNGAKRQRWLFLVQENYEPFDCSLVDLSPGALEIAESKRAYAKNLFAQCMRANRWPGYGTRIASAEPPAWEVTESEIRRVSPPSFDERLDYLDA